MSGKDERQFFQRQGQDTTVSDADTDTSRRDICGHRLAFLLQLARTALTDMNPVDKFTKELDASTLWGNTKNR